MCKEPIDAQKEHLKKVACYLIDKLPRNPLGGYEPREMSLEIDFVEGAHKGLKKSTRFPELDKKIEELKDPWERAKEVIRQG